MTGGPDRTRPSLPLPAATWVLHLAEVATAPLADPHRVLVPQSDHATRSVTGGPR